MIVRSSLRTRHPCSRLLTKEADASRLDDCPDTNNERNSGICFVGPRQDPLSRLLVLDLASASSFSFRFLSSSGAESLQINLADSKTFATFKIMTICCCFSRFSKHPSTPPHSPNRPAPNPFSYPIQKSSGSETDSNFTSANAHTSRPSTDQARQQQRSSQYSAAQSSTYSGLSADHEETRLRRAAMKERLRRDSTLGRELREEERRELGRSASEGQRRRD